MLNPTQCRGDEEAVRYTDAIANRIFFDPLFKGAYPTEVIERTAHHTDWSFVQDGDLELISQPIDLLGLNYYNPSWFKDAPGAPENPVGPGSAGIGQWTPEELDVTDMGWPIDASGLTDLLLRVHKDYGVPTMITENGAAYPTGPDANGEVVDTERVDYLRSHIAAVHDAITQGADVRGYTAWSLLDNFEWAFGYDKRFGLVYVDYATQRRIPKASAKFYTEVIAANGLDR